MGRERKKEKRSVSQTEGKETELGGTHILEELFWEGEISVPGIVAGEELGRIFNVFIIPRPRYVVLDNVPDAVEDYALVLVVF